MYRSLKPVAIVVAAGLLIVGQAAGSTITTTSFASWQTDLTGGYTDLNFTETLQNYNTAAGITLFAKGNSSVAFNFTGPDGAGYALSGYLYNNNMTVLAGASDGTGTIKVTTPSGGENALMMWVGSTANTQVTLKLSDGESFTLSGGSLAPFGFALSQAITSFTLSTTSGSQAFIDDLVYGNSNLAQNTSSVPEGSTFALLAGGLLVLVGSKRKLKLNRRGADS
jgi:hypothetical protein